MEILAGSKKIKTAVFISGTGSNLKSLIKFSKLKKSPIIIKMIISNNYNAKGLQYANIYCFFHWFGIVYRLDVTFYEKESRTGLQTIRSIIR